MTYPPAANEPSVGEPADRDTAPENPSPADSDESPTVAAADPAADAPTGLAARAPAEAADEPAAETEQLPADAPRYEADYFDPEAVAEPFDEPAPIPVPEDGGDAHRAPDEPTAEQPQVEPTAEQPQVEPTAEQPRFEPIPPSAPRGSAGPPPPPPPPPPFGAQPGPFPGTSGFNRRALVRPTQGRYIAGVCAAVGRATNTDPLLWRVLFAVMTLAGGIGLLAYLLGWLLIPADGDTGSPVEAMFGRGRTATSPPLVIIIAVTAVMTFAWVVSRNVGSAVLGLAVIVGTLALLARNNNSNNQQQPQPPYPPPPPDAPPAYPGFTGHPPAPPAYPSMQSAARAEPPQVDTTGLEDDAVGTPASAPPVPPSPPWPPAPPVPPMPPLPTPGGYRPPFAPHGPYASTSPYAASLGYPMSPNPPMGAYPGLVTPAKPPKPPRQRSKLGRLTLSMIAIALGVLFIVNLNGGSVSPPVFLATILFLISAGLIVGAWFGRARWLIPVGVVMTIVLAAGTGAQRFTNARNIANIDVTPAALAEVQPNYSTDVGNIHLDLSQVDFSGQTTNVEVDSTVGGNVEIVLPPTVDAIVKTDVQGGNCQLFGKDLGGGLNQQHTVTDNGADGQGGGTLNLTVDVNFGNVEVHR